MYGVILLSICGCASGLFLLRHASRERRMLCASRHLAEELAEKCMALLTLSEIALQKANASWKKYESLQYAPQGEAERVREKYKNTLARVTASTQALDSFRANGVSVDDFSAAKLSRKECATISAKLTVHKKAIHRLIGQIRTLDTEMQFLARMKESEVRMHRITNRIETGEPYGMP